MEHKLIDMLKECSIEYDCHSCKYYNEAIPDCLHNLLMKAASELSKRGTSDDRYFYRSSKMFMEDKAQESERLGGSDTLCRYYRIAAESIGMRIPEKPVRKPLRDDHPEIGERILCPRCGAIICNHKHRAGPMSLGPDRCICGQLLDWSENTPPSRK